MTVAKFKTPDGVVTISGTPGPTGARGPAGPAGAQGPAGPQGPAGTTFTDAQIGDKAFSNPPNDLNATEQLAVRTAIGIQRVVGFAGFATRTAYAAGTVVAYNGELYFTTRSIPDTNTALPTAGGNFEHLTVDAFVPSKANLYSAVKAILVHAGNTGVTADDTNNEIDIAAGGSTTSQVINIPSGATSGVSLGIAGGNDNPTDSRPNGVLSGTTFYMDYRDVNNKVFVFDQGTSDSNFQLADLGNIAGTANARNEFLDIAHKFIIVNLKRAGNITFLRAGGIADISPANPIIVPGYAGNIDFWGYGATRYRLSVKPFVPEAESPPAASESTAGLVRGATSAQATAASGTTILGWTNSRLRQLINTVVPAVFRTGDTSQIAVAKLGTGTPSATNFLAGDGAWKTPAGGGITPSILFSANVNIAAANTLQALAGNPVWPASDSMLLVQIRRQGIPEQVFMIPNPRVAQTLGGSNPTTAVSAGALGNVPRDNSVLLTASISDSVPEQFYFARTSSNQILFSASGADLDPVPLVIARMT